MDYNFHWEVIGQSTDMLLKGAGNTIILSIITIFTSTVLGIIIGILRTFGKSKLENKTPKGYFLYGIKMFLYAVSSTYVEVMRGTPLLVQIFVVYFGLPSIGIEIKPYPAALLALTICYGAYGAEIVRAGIESIDKGQLEASRSLGLNYLKTLQFIILPQALKRVIPPLTSQFAALIKDTSLVSVISITELTFSAQNVITRTFRSFEIWIATAIIYFTMTFAVSLISKYFERRGEQQ